MTTAVRNNRLVRVARGCYVDAEAWVGTSPEDERRRLEIRTVGAQLRVRGAAATHTSSAILADLPVWSVPGRACVTVRPMYTGDARAAHLHRAQLPIEHLIEVDGRLRTRAARTVLDIAREHDIEDAIVVGDAALARGMTSGDRLLACAERCAGWPGSRRMNQVLGLLDPRSESPLESVSRLRLARAGVARPEPQVEIFTLNGLFVGRLDFYWDEFGVAGEVDGALKYRDDPVLAIIKEKRRQEAMEELGLIFVRWGRSDLERMPELRARLERAFARGALRPSGDRGWVARATTSLAPLRSA